MVHASLRNLTEFPKFCRKGSDFTDKKKAIWINTKGRIYGTNKSMDWWSFSPLIIVYSRGAAYRENGEFFCIRGELLVVSAVLKTD